MTETVFSVFRRYSEIEKTSFRLYSRLSVLNFVEVLVYYIYDYLFCRFNFWNVFLLSQPAPFPREKQGMGQQSAVWDQNTPTFSKNPVMGSTKVFVLFLWVF